MPKQVPRPKPLPAKTSQNNSAPNLATKLINRNTNINQQSQSNLKSFGELNPYSIDSDDENDTKYCSRKKTRVLYLHLFVYIYALFVVTC